MAKKGNGYDEKAAVGEAIRRCQWTPQKFFAEAKKRGGVNGFDALAASEKFAAFQKNPAAHSDIAIPRPVVTFADWVLTKDIKDLHTRLHDPSSGA